MKLTTDKINNFHSWVIILFFAGIIILGITGMIDKLLNPVFSILDGFRSGTTENYTPGENFPNN